MTREEARENRAIVHVDSDGNITYLSETGGKLNVNSTVQNPTANPETGLAASAKPLADNQHCCCREQAFYNIQVGRAYL